MELIGESKARGPRGQGRFQHLAGLVVALPGLQCQAEANGGDFAGFTQVPDRRRDPPEADGRLERADRQVQPVADQHVVAQRQQELQVEREILASESRQAVNWLACISGSSSNVVKRP